MVRKRWKADLYLQLFRAHQTAPSPVSSPDFGELLAPHIHVDPDVTQVCLTELPVCYPSILFHIELLHCSQNHMPDVAYDICQPRQTIGTGQVIRVESGLAAQDLPKARTSVEGSHSA